jgi:cbb3-type cytochrome c oxidase subunit III
MKGNHCCRRSVVGLSGLVLVLGVSLVLGTVGTRKVRAGGRDCPGCGPHGNAPGCFSGACGLGSQFCGEPGGTWFWIRSPDEERTAIIGLFNRYCIRCHGVDGRGVWDIPAVPNFTNARWQASRSDGQLVRIILEGRGAVMPPFRGTLTLEEGWGMARYLRTFLPGTESPLPDLNPPPKPPKR